MTDNTETKPSPTVEDMNRVIAEFMGFKKIGVQSFEIPNLFPPEVDTGWIQMHKSELIFHSSWDWLMPVVEKIESKITPVEILDTQCRIGRTIYNPQEILISSDNSKIEAVHQAIYDFIIWFNQQSKKP